MKRYLRQINLVIQDRNKKKKLPQILKEFIQLSLKKKELALYYGGKYLYRAHVKNPQDYLSVKESFKLTQSPAYHKFEHTSILQNKLSFAFYFENYDFPIPRLISYNLGERFFYEKKKHIIKNPKDLQLFFAKILQEQAVSGLFVKPIALLGGKGCFLLKSATLEEDIQNIEPGFFKEGFIHQELVEQHPILKRVYPPSLNTLRFVTYLSEDGTPHILSCYISFGAGGSVADNGHSGGFHVAVNMETGTISGAGQQSMSSGGRMLTRHPDTEVVFDGIIIPFFNKARELVLSALEHLPDRYIGWDIGISKTGPVLIEGNDNASLRGSDIAFGGYLKHPLFNEILKNA